MPRSIWNGTISFGLVAVPIKVHSATEDHSVHFRQVHDRDGAAIKQRRICSKEGQEVPYEEVAKGYETSQGVYVLLTQDEIDAAAGDRAHVIDLEEFVRTAEVDPVFFDRAYYLGAGDDGADAYRLLHDALKRSQRAGIGRWVFHNREYLVAVRPLDGVLALQTMRFADELVNPETLEVAQPAKAPGKCEVEMAITLVESLHGSFDPKAFKDSHRQRVLKLIERKAKGEKVELEPAEAPEETPDLIAALEASLKGRGSRPAGGKPRPGGTSRKARSGSTGKTRSKAS